MGTTNAHRATGFLGAVAAAGALPITLIHLPAAAADPCPDVEVVFARGTTEPPGVGGVGQAFVDSLRSQLGDRSVGLYAVDYPASRDFDSSTPAGAGTGPSGMFQRMGPALATGARVMVASTPPAMAHNTARRSM